YLLLSGAATFTCTNLAFNNTGTTAGNMNYISFATGSTVTFTAGNKVLADYQALVAAGNIRVDGVVQTDFSKFQVTGTGGHTLSLAPTGPTITAGALSGAVSTTYGTASAPATFTVSGVLMTAGITVTPPTGFEVSTAFDFSSNVGNPATPITVGSAGTIGSTTVYVRLAATAPVSGSYNAHNIVLTSTGATLVNVATATTGNTVSKASLSVTANNQTKGYGQTVAFGSGSTLFTSSGLRNGETIDSVTLACAGGAAGAAVGLYDITPGAATGVTFDANNYDITYTTTGKLTVLALNTYAFGTTNTGALVLDGDGKIVTRGQAPIIQTTVGSALVQLTYARLKNSGCAYSAEFSDHLGDWLASTDPSLIYPPGVPTEVVVDNGDGMEVVSVKFPIFRNNGGSYEKMQQSFCRIAVTTNP
ncbi:MAG: MBG domain-containing protein, partial [Verrucomicrobiota bacterium]